jgi:DNA-directed RNA polymerase subunit M/transcription elongation factor TFIIS
MDLTFNCPHCQQELVVDAAGAGTNINCPTCEAEITIPQPDITNIHTAPPASTAAAAKEEKHFRVPVRDSPSEILVKKKKSEEEEGATAGLKIRVRVIRHSDCVELGVDSYEKHVAEFLNKVGEENIINLSTLTYNHLDLATEKILVDYGIQIIYRT